MLPLYLLKDVFWYYTCCSICHSEHVLIGKDLENPWVCTQWVEVTDIPSFNRRSQLNSNSSALNALGSIVGKNSEKNFQDVLVLCCLNKQVSFRMDVQIETFLKSEQIQLILKKYLLVCKKIFLIGKYSITLPHVYQALGTVCTNQK